ncbi:TPA: DsbA family protein [Klebsiella quasipneumoniae subsp. similipneumoniae]|nr:DsbA family protein [Klebsiella quasipneumoniae subsp. similipneumoniae]
MLKFFSFLLPSLLLFFSNCSASYAQTLLEGKQYSKLVKEIKDAPEVIEFFSFYCPPCAAFSIHLGINKVLEKNLPNNLKLVKYHVNTMGELGQELTDAWSIATVLGVQDEVEEPLFKAVQEKRNIHTEEDIKKIFIDAGVSAEKFDSVKNSFAVRAMTQKQINAAKDFKVVGTPSFYIAGKYVVHNNGIEGSDISNYSSEFSNVVNALLDK